jgi:acyl carrier protein
MQILEHLLSRHSTQVGVSPIDWSLLSRQSRTGRQSPFFANISETRPDAAAQDQYSSIQTLALGTVAPAERRARVAACLCVEIAAVLRLAPEDVDLHQPLNRIGLDSLMAVELRNRLRFRLGLDVPLVTFMQDTSVTDLAADLSQRLAEAADRKEDGAGSAKPGPDSGASISSHDVEPLLDRLDQLSDDEVDALLGAVLSGKLPDEMST